MVNHVGLGGGLTDFQFINTLFAKNEARHYGGGIYFDDANSTTCGALGVFKVCTLAENVADSSGGGIYLATSVLHVRSSILWGNTDDCAQDCQDPGCVCDQAFYTAQIHTQGFPLCADPLHLISNSDVQGLDLLIHTNDNINDDPLFNASDPQNEFQLGSGSPCIDTGNNADVPSGLTVDLIHWARIFNGTVDMGAYEFCSEVGCDDADVCTFDCCGSPTCTNDGTNPYGDVHGGKPVGEWCNHPVGSVCGPDGDVDLDDILAELDAFAGIYAEGCDLHNYDLFGSPPAPVGCEPNGVINLDDISVVIAAFGGCDRCCSGGCPEGAPSSPSRTGSGGEAVALELELRPADPSAPQTIQVDIFAGPASDLQGYQMTVYVAGDVPGNVTLEGFYVDTTRPDFIFSEMDAVDAFDPSGWRFACARLGGGSAVTDRAYLGTCVMHVAGDATGIAQISLDATGGTMLRDSFGLPVDVILPDAMDLILP